MTASSIGHASNSEKFLSILREDCLSPLLSAGLDAHPSVSLPLVSSFRRWREDEVEDFRTRELMKTEESRRDSWFQGR